MVRTFVKQCPNDDDMMWRRGRAVARSENLEELVVMGGDNVPPPG